MEPWYFLFRKECPKAMYHLFTSRVMWRRRKDSEVIQTNEPMIFVSLIWCSLLFLHGNDCALLLFSQYALFFLECSAGYFPQQAPGNITGPVLCFLECKADPRQNYDTVHEASQRPFLLLHNSTFRMSQVQIIASKSANLFALGGDSSLQIG